MSYIPPPLWQQVYRAGPFFMVGAASLLGAIRAAWNLWRIVQAQKTEKLRRWVWTTYKVRLPE